MNTGVETQESKYEQLLAWFSGKGSVTVAFSGGVDSTLVLAAAKDSLPSGRVLAAIADSASLPRRELNEARRLALELQVPLLELSTEELEDESYQKNAGDRCFFCKKHLYQNLTHFLKRLPHEIQTWAKKVEISPEIFSSSTLVDGLNLDDLSDERPGVKAAELFGVRHPLVELGLTKSEVRELSRGRGLPTHDKPEMACLASRIPVGVRVSKEKLHGIELVETRLQALGFRHFRVRYHELAGAAEVSPTKLCRLEFSPEEIERASEPAIRQEISVLAREAGFSFVTVDLEGYRKGGRPA